MTNFMQQPLAEAATSAPAWLTDTRSRGQSAWSERRLPTRKTEAWKYNDLRALQHSFTAPTGGEPPTLEGIDLPQLEGSLLLFTDGVFCAQGSTLDLPEGVQLVRFADADTQEARAIVARLGTAVNHGRHLFAPLNDATLADGVFLRVAADTLVEQPIQIVWLTSGRSDALSVTQRLLVDMGPNSQATVVETFANTETGGVAFTNGITELLLADGAQLNHNRLHLEHGRAVHIGGVHALLGANANLNSFHLALGSDLKRIDIVVQHEGPGAHCDVNGIYLPRGQEQIDYHTCMEHAVPHCTSTETFRGIIADQAKAVFNGRIHIHPDAQKTNAQLSNKNLLTSNQAEVNTKPELEIYADDVQCAHGATVAQMDATSLHYLRTRGISQAEAQVMLSYGFVNELVDAIPCEAVRSFLKPLLAKRFALRPELAEHLA